MKINYSKLITVLEKKSNRAIDRLDELKCYSVEFKETLDSIIMMLEASKKIETYDTECLHCKEDNLERDNSPQNNPRPTRESQVGKPYKTFKEEDYE
jgi:hypothetical protein